MLYIVTGAAGHLGNNVVRLLVEKGERVRALILPSERELRDLPEGVEIIEGNVLQPESLEPLFAGEDEQIVIHCAGIVSVATKYSQALFDVNVHGTENLLALCREHNVRRVVYVSSVHAIPEAPDGKTITETRTFDPARVKGWYAKSKAAATKLVLAYAAEGRDACVVHPSGMLGPGDYGHGHLTQLLLDYCSGALRAGVTKGGYDFADVRDVAAGILDCCERGRSGECYILSNRYYPIRELLEHFHLVTGLHRVRAFLPLWVAKATAPLAETYYKLRHSTPLFTRYSISTLTSNGRFSHQKADRELGYHTRPLDETIADTYRWLCEEGRLKKRPRKIRCRLSAVPAGR